MKKIFLDTNIILDLLDDQRDHYRDAVWLFEYLSKNPFLPVISEDMISTIYYIRKNNKKVLKFYEYVLEHWSVVPYGLPLIKDAVKLSSKFGYDLEDTLQCLCAKKEGCSIVVTEDKGFVDCGIEVYDYERFAREK